MLTNSYCKALIKTHPFFLNVAVESCEDDHVSYKNILLFSFRSQLFQTDEQLPGGSEVSNVPGLLVLKTLLRDT